MTTSAINTLNIVSEDPTAYDISQLSNSLNDSWGDNETDISNTTFDYVQLLQQSWWNIFDRHFFRHNLTWTIVLAMAYLLILFVGVIGNCMVILVVLLRQRMRSVTIMFIMNLAVADLFVIVFCVPATLLSNIFAPWILGSFMCKGVAYVQGVSVCASAYSLAAISIDRCLAVYRPFRRPSGLTKSQGWITIFLIWTIALTLTIPWAVTFNIIPNTNGLESCVETWGNEYHGKMYFFIANFIMFYCCPMIIISIANLAIWFNITRRKVPHSTAYPGPIRRMHRKTRLGVLKMLGIVTFTFLISWLPLYTIVMRTKFGENISDSEVDILHSLMPFAQWLGSWNSSINPVLYAFLNNKFREMFKSLLPKWFPFVQRQSHARGTMRRTEVSGAVGNGPNRNTRSIAETSFVTAPTSHNSTSYTHSGQFQSYRNRSSSNDGQGGNTLSREASNLPKLSAQYLHGNVKSCTSVFSRNRTVTNLYK